MTRLRIAEWPGWMTTDGLTRARSNYNKGNDLNHLSQRRGSGKDMTSRGFGEGCTWMID